MKAEYVDHMGTDLSVVNAARVSFANVSTWEVVSDEAKKLKDADKRLIDFLGRGCTKKEWSSLISEIINEYDSIKIEHALNSLTHMAKHWVPFTHTAITLRMKAPVPIRTQCFKHKQGFTESEESRRYIRSIPQLYIPEYLRSAPIGDKKQGSGEKHKNSSRFIDRYISSCKSAIDLYIEMIDDRICPEQARFVLPQGVEVNWIWTGNLASYARYYNQRIDSHAQKESQWLAEDVGKIISELFPVSWDALTAK